MLSFNQIFKGYVLKVLPVYWILTIVVKVYLSLLHQFCKPFDQSLDLDIYDGHKSSRVMHNSLIGLWLGQYAYP